MTLETRNFFGDPPVTITVCPHTQKIVVAAVFVPLTDMSPLPCKLGERGSTYQFCQEHDLDAPLSEIITAFVAAIEAQGFSSRQIRPIADTHGRGVGMEWWTAAGLRNE